ncbi:hypothetical protein CK203_065758 [Vitis vinifera]|uniref:RNase H type-1 domain-containing protein n=1 Tax=Vitis vinifera TaxID=29760 RepID=A0A438G2Q2_VITVI|nr:hypothetical protein CK203_065758 [Vitis vinifera]
MGEPSPLRNPLGKRGSACVEVMTTLHGSTPSPWRRVEGCVPPEGEFIVTSLDWPSWIRVGDRFTKASDQSNQRSDQGDMDSQIVTIDQFAAAMASIQEAIASLGQRIDGQQAQQVLVQEDTQFDTTVPPPPLHSQPAPRTIPFTLHNQTEVAPPPAIVPTPISEDPHARMDKLEQKLRQMRTSEGAITWEDFDGAPVASLPAKFRMPEIERYTGIGCPRIHLRLYSTVMRAHGLDDAQMVMLFPMSLSGAAQRWFASLEVSRRRTWDDLAQEFLRQFAFNTVIDVLRRELEALRQRPEESVTSFISRWREKISQIINRPSERDQISMIMRTLQPRFARHLMGFPHTDFGSLRPSGGQRSGDVGAISLVGMRPSRRYQTVGQTLGTTIHLHLMRITDQPTPSRPMTPTYLHPDSQPVFAAHVAERPPAPYTRPRAPQITTYVQRPPRQFAQLGHDTDHCTALRHAIQDLIDQGLVNLGQPSVTTNPLPAHSTHAVHPSSGDIHHMDLIEDDSIHMLSWDDGLPKLIVLHDSYEVDGVSLVPQTLAPFSLIPDEAPFQLTHPIPLVIRCQDAFVPFTLWPEDDDSIGREIQIMTRSGRIAQPPPTSNDDLPPDGLDHVHPLYITVGCSGRRVRLYNGSALNVCPLATAIALGFAAFRFWSTMDHVAGSIPSSLHQKMKFIHDGQVITVSSIRDIFAASEPVLQISHSEDDLLLTGFTFDEIQTLEIEDFHRDFVAMSFDSTSSTVVLDMMRGMTFLPGMGLGRHQQGPSEFIAAIDHDTTFGLGFIPTEADYRHMARLRKERVRARLSHTPIDYPIRPYRMSLADYFVRGSKTRPHLEEIDSVAHTDRETDLQHLFHQQQLSDGAPDTSFPMAITPTSPDRASMLSLCFPEEITGDGVMVDSTEMIDGVVSHDKYRDEMDMMTMSQITSIVQLQPISAFDMFGVSTIKVFEGTQTLPVPELPEDDSNLFEGIVSPVEGASDLVDPPLSFDVFIGIYDEIAQPSSDKDSFDHDSGPIYERVSPAAGDVETVDFGTEDQPRELKIGSPLSTDERDRLIHLLRSYLDVFAWSYEDMPVVEYPEWLANVVPVPKKDGKVRVCVDFRDLNKASPKDDFPLPQLIRIWRRQPLLLSGGTYCYRVMPFGLKNARATYQRAATTCIHNMMHWDVEVYVDDMIVKSRGRADHLDALERFFERIRNERGIEVDPDKIKAILDMPAQRLRKRSGEEPATVWNDDCQFAFEKIKEYLLSPPCFSASYARTSLLLYLSVSDMALGSLVWATRRLRHYMTEYSMDLISHLDPLRYLFDRPALTGRLMRWLVLLTEFDIQYVSQKSIKGSIVVDHLASLPTSEDRPVDDDFPDEEFVAMTSLSGWCLYFDGAANQLGYGIGVLLVSPQGDHIPRSVRLAFHDRHPITNNIVQYEACILGLETALELGIRQMEVFGDSNLVLRQIQEDWKTRDVKLRPYHAYLELLVARFDDLRYVHMPRAHNRFADTLATLASSVDISIDFLRSGTYPEVATTKDRRALRNLATRFVICGDTLYRRSADGMLLLCLDRASADRVNERGSPKSSSGHEFILVAIDYFTKWVEAASYARLTSARVASFIRSHIICRYGVPHELISDRGVHFRAETNGAVEAVNKNIKRILRKMAETSRDWSEKLPFALWAYRTSFRNSTGATPYSLVYGMEAVCQSRQRWAQLRVALEQQISDTEWAQARFDQLNLLDERRIESSKSCSGLSEKDGSCLQETG